MGATSDTSDMSSTFENALSSPLVASPSRESSTYESIDDSSSRGSWYWEREYLRPNSLLPKSIFQDEEHDPIDESNRPTKCNPNIKIENEDNQLTEQILPEPTKVSLFKPKIKLEPANQELLVNKSESSPAKKQCLQPLNVYEENELLSQLNKKLETTGVLTPYLYRLRRKLCLRNQQREHNVPVFNLDHQTKFLKTHRRSMTRKEKLDCQVIDTRYNVSKMKDRVLDRFYMNGSNSNQTKKDSRTSFREKLMGSLTDSPDPIYSPYTLRTLKPYIFRDYETVPKKLKLLRQIRAYSHRNDKSWIEPPRPPIDYGYITAKHIPAINSLARIFFWPGIELSEVLQYPDYTCVVQYLGLVIGFGIIVPDVNLNEAYISFLFVHPEWQDAGIGKLVLYHLIQTCIGKDITLHVSASNPAIILYQKFGFKVEEFLKDFYDKYFSVDSNECKHAMFMRMNR